MTGEKQKFDNFGASPFAYSGSKQLSPSKISNSLEIKGELTLGYPSAHKGAESDTEGSENVKERLSDLYESTNVSTRIPRTSKLSEKIQSFSTRFKDQAFNYTPDHVYKSSVSTGYGIFRPKFNNSRRSLLLHVPKRKPHKQAKSKHSRIKFSKIG